MTAHATLAGAGGLFALLLSGGAVARPAVAAGETPMLPGKALRLDGKGYLEIPHHKRLNCLGGVTLAAWIRPEPLPPNGARLIDKSPVGVAAGYNLDTYPGHSLRLITRDPWVSFNAKLPPGQWTHVAATVDGGTGHSVLYINGKLVKDCRP